MGINHYCSEKMKEKAMEEKLTEEQIEERVNGWWVKNMPDQPPYKQQILSIWKHYLREENPSSWTPTMESVINCIEMIESLECPRYSMQV